MQTIRWGIIGCGDVTEVKSGPAFQKAKYSELIAVMRRNKQKAADYAKRHRVQKWYSDADKLINDPDVDAIYIATPPHYHKYYTLKVAKVKKPVYVEKPMARTYSECQEMIKSCDEAGISLFTAYYRRSLPIFLKIKEILNNNQIGNIRFVKIALYHPPMPGDLDAHHLPWRVIPEISGGGYFVDLASHTLDILDFLIGPISKVSGLADNQANRYPAEDIVTAIFTFSNGIIGMGLWYFNASRQVDTVKIVGDHGKIIFSIFMNEPILLKIGDSEKSFEFERPQHIQQPHIQSIIDELNGIGKCPSNGISAARTSWVMDEILKDWRIKKGIHFAEQEVDNHI
jgi:predicted dehydrogenase